MLKKIGVILILIILAVSNMMLIYQNNTLVRENKKLMLFNNSEKVNAAAMQRYDMITTLQNILALEKEYLENGSETEGFSNGRLQSLYFRGDMLSISLNAPDIQVLQEKEKQITRTVRGETPETEITADGNSVRANLIYGGLR